MSDILVEGTRICCSILNFGGVHVAFLRGPRGLFGGTMWAPRGVDV
jgi:hypothetical protein